MHKILKYIHKINSVIYESYKFELAFLIIYNYIIYNWAPKLYLYMYIEYYTAKSRNYLKILYIQKSSCKLENFVHITCRYISPEFHKKIKETILYSRSISIFKINADIIKKNKLCMIDHNTQWRANNPSPPKIVLSLIFTQIPRK